MTSEEWRLITGYPYEVSDQGRVRRCGGRPLKLKAKKERYLFVCFSVAGVHTYHHVSRLVCAAFHGPPPAPEFHAEHEDENRQNNWSTNLRWMSPEENRARRRPMKGEMNGNAKIPDAGMPSILARTDTAAALAARYGVTANHIRKIWRGECRRVDNQENAFG